MQKSDIEIAQEEQTNNIKQLKNLAGIYGFDVDLNIHKGQCMILCGKKRRWGNSYKRYAVPSTTEYAFRDVKYILASGGKVFGIK